MAQKKRTAPKKNQKQKKVEEKNRFANQIKAIVIMAISIFLLAIVLIPVKNLGSAGASDCSASAPTYSLLCLAILQ